MVGFIPNKLKSRVEQWRDNDYACECSAISEILTYNFTEVESDEKTLRFLRSAQFEALETYWYLRTIEKTPHIFELYRRLFEDPPELLKALGVSLSQEDLIKLLSNGGMDSIFEEIKTDDDFVKKYRLDALRETLTLDYPSYILALAMGSGKTILIGAIIATEFAMALEYPDKNFVKNALVFAPGKTILGALKEISDIPFGKILPPRLYKQFMSSVKITYTQNGEKDIPIIRGSCFNIVVTNTEKIRIQKPTSRVVKFNLLNFKEIEKFKEEREMANMRLQTIASLPNLAIFSDEAHHTYGQSLEKGLKKVRKTVDYLAENTNVIVVVNTTGTPYFKKQTLKDVIYWYGLSQGIKDGILKEVKDSIYSYEDISSEDFVKIVIKDFFKDYKDVRIYDGAQSKLAIYFPQTNDLERMKPTVEATLIELGLDPSMVLEVHNKSKDETKDLFNNRVNESHNPYRVYLLVNMGTEGWNCPSLFATALARKLKSSNNFVLQAATRCLRQIPANKRKARIYLSKENVRILDAQLKETFGETLQILDMTRPDMRKERLILRKTEIPPISIRRKIKRVVLKEDESDNIVITRPGMDPNVSKRIIYDVVEETERKGVLSEKELEDVVISEDFSDIYGVAVDLSNLYRIDLSDILEALKEIYPEREVSMSHIVELKKQIENQMKNYEIMEEEVEVALALVKPNGFNKEVVDGRTMFTTEIIYHKDKEDLLLRYEEFEAWNKRDFSFHYSPYNTDSHPEKDFFLRLLKSLNEDPDGIEDIYFTGAISDPEKTDFLFEYRDKDGKWRTYTPDFVIRKKNGRVLIVEIKGDIFRDETKEMAMRELEHLNPDKLKYEILLTKTDEIGFENVNKIKNWIYG